MFTKMKFAINITDDKYSLFLKQIIYNQSTQDLENYP